MKHLLILNERNLRTPLPPFPPHPTWAPPPSAARGTLAPGSFLRMALSSIYQEVLYYMGPGPL